MFAVVLLRLQPMEEERVSRELLELPQVRKAHLIDGEHDALLIVEGQDPSDIARFVYGSLRKIRGVDGTIVETIQPFKMPAVVA